MLGNMARKNAMVPGEEQNLTVATGDGGTEIWHGKMLGFLGKWSQTNNIEKYGTEKC